MPMDTITASKAIATRFNLRDHAQADIRLGMDALLRHGITNAKTAPSYARTMTDWLVKNKYLPDSTDIVELHAALESSALAILGEK